MAEPSAPPPSTEQPAMDALQSAADDLSKISCQFSDQIQIDPFSLCSIIKSGELDALNDLQNLQKKLTASKQDLDNEIAKKEDQRDPSKCFAGNLYDKAYAEIMARLKILDLQTQPLLDIYGRLIKKPWKIHKSYFRVACVGDCVKSANGSSEQCERKCKASSEDLAQITKSLNLSIAEIQTSSPATELFSAAEKEMQVVENIINTLTKDFGKEIKRMQAEKKELMAREKKLLESYSCMREKKELMKKVKAASARAEVENKGMYGSGVYVKTTDKEGKEHFSLLTAHHVPRKRSTSPYSIGLEVTDFTPSEDVQKTTSNKHTTREEFSVEPGRYDRGNDVVSKKVSPRVNALKVSPKEKIPSQGVELFISGHPGTAMKEFAMHRCTFLGFIPGGKALGMRYLLDCPSVSVKITGASGGAVVDREGVLWGITSAQYYGVVTAAIEVAPVSSDENGNLNYGMQNTFVTDDCIRFIEELDNFQYYRCQISPGLEFLDGMKEMATPPPLPTPVAPTPPVPTPDVAPTAPAPQAPAPEPMPEAAPAPVPSPEPGVDPESVPETAPESTPEPVLPPEFTENTK